MKAATVLAAAFNMDKAISIHAAREGGDMHTSEKETSHKVFQSTPPVKAATLPRDCVARTGRISIHAAREGGDDVVAFVNVLDFYISIHAAREGGDCGNV